MVQVVQQSGSQQWQDDRNKKTAGVLKEMEGRSKEAEAAKRAAELGIPYIDLQVFPTNENDVKLIPEEDARKHQVTLFEKTGSLARIAFKDPENDDSKKFIAELAEKYGWQVEQYIATGESIEKAWIAYKSGPLLESFDLWRVSLQGDDLKKFEDDFGELLKLKESSKIPVSQTIEIILAGANKLRSSDIHIEPGGESVRIRYRIDGLLQEVGVIGNDVYRLMVSRVKMLSKMKINVRDRAQDGHFSTQLGEKKIDLRVNLIPGKYGENINMRLLSSDDAIVPVEELGLRGLAYDEVKKQMAKPHGMIVNTGPTGSGKTTTLYSILGALNQSDVKIITIEDPIEYSLPGVVQTEVSKDKAYTFGQALRAVVRQDPDIILVGEIRDEETADVAINAALTGHLVLTTLHANNAPAAIPRFIELGVKRDLITASINALIAQRLVRKLCDQCKESYEPAEQTVELLRQLIAIISPKAKVSIKKEVPVLWKTVGCPACNFTGYHGRVGIFEIFTMTPRLVKAIDDMGTEDVIMKAALEDGMVTMTQDGILKAIDGITTIEEVWRVADQGDMLQEIYQDLMSSSLSSASTIPNETFAQAKAHSDSLEHFDAYAKTLEHKDLLHLIMAGAILLHAGDINLEPGEDGVSVRFRLDGILKHVATIPANEYPAVLGEIKLWSKMKTSERAGVADGRFSLTIGEGVDSMRAGKVDFRVSIILGGYGETVDMRVLSQSSAKLNLESLNIRKENLERILEAVRKPYGMVINTGPTGSGKTTTLYSILAHINSPEVKIITVEDPIEYQIPGLLQTQVNEKEGYSFSTALRALLRQNPDIMMIGEIRDEETAQIAVQAATTGHLVVSTLHANSAAGAIPRIVNMGVRSDDLANAGNAFIAQRLVRKLCDDCKRKDTPTEEEILLLKETLKDRFPESQGGKVPSVYRSGGCPKCNGTGFAGQIVLSEVLLVDKEIEEAISRGLLASEIEALATGHGMITIVQDGLLASIEGRTTIEEVRRVTEI